MTLSLLQKIRDSLYKNVCMDIKLRESADDNVYNYKLVNPKAFVGWIPPISQNAGESLECLLTEMESQKSVPCLLVSYDEDEDDGQSNTTNVRLIFAVYGPGLQIKEKEIIEEYTGYESLINFMDRTKAFLLRTKLALGVTAIVSSVKSSLYKEQPFPIWMGSLTFTCQNEPYVNLDVANIENSFLL